MDRNLEKLERKKAELQAKKNALKAEEQKLKSAVKDHRNKARNGQLHVLGLVIDHVMRHADPDHTTRDFLHKYGRQYFTRPIDKARFEEAFRLIQDGLALGTLPNVPDSYQEQESSPQ